MNRQKVEDSFEEIPPFVKAHPDNFFLNNYKSKSLYCETLRRKVFCIKNNY